MELSTVSSHKLELPFLEKNRTDLSEQRPSETPAEFLDRAAHECYELQRQQFNRLLAIYPAGEDEKCKQRLIGRLSKKGAHSQFIEAYFELQAHAILAENGVTFISIEGETLDNGRTPDFLCRNNGQTFLVEAVTINDKPNYEKAIDELKWTLKSLGKTGRVAELTVLKIPQNPSASGLPTGEICNVVKERIKELAADGELTIPYQRNGWELLLHLRHPERKRGYFVAICEHPMFQVNTKESVAKKLADKVSRYKVRLHPLVMMVNLNTGFWGSPFEDAVSALYGNLSMAFNPDTVEQLSLPKELSTAIFGLLQTSSTMRSVAAFLFAAKTDALTLGIPPLLLVENPFWTGPDLLGGLNIPRVRINPCSKRVEVFQGSIGAIPASDEWFTNLLEAGR